MFAISVAFLLSLPRPIPSSHIICAQTAAIRWPSEFPTDGAIRVIRLVGKPLYNACLAISIRCVDVIGIGALRLWGAHIALVGVHACSYGRLGRPNLRAHSSAWYLSAVDLYERREPPAIRLIIW